MIELPVNVAFSSTASFFHVAPNCSTVTLRGRRRSSTPMSTLHSPLLPPPPSWVRTSRVLDPIAAGLRQKIPHIKVRVFCDANDAACTLCVLKSCFSLSDALGSALQRRYSPSWVDSDAVTPEFCLEALETNTVSSVWPGRYTFWCDTNMPPPPPIATISCDFRNDASCFFSLASIPAAPFGKSVGALASSPPNSAPSPLLLCAGGSDPPPLLLPSNTF
mmetsp:Transcript_25529/g.35630  ORF Transcript_25529/g.35630 Transcript_25529/m.35630 type:complete len:219 (+) Transcript_25529:340-996(+)